MLCHLRNAECHYDELHYAECHYNECHYDECYYAECYYAGCHYAECLGAIQASNFKAFLILADACEN